MPRQQRSLVGRSGRSICSSALRGIIGQAAFRRRARPARTGRRSEESLRLEVAARHAGRGALLHTVRIGEARGRRSPHVPPHRHRGRARDPGHGHAPRRRRGVIPYPLSLGGPRHHGPGRGLTTVPRGAKPAFRRASDSFPVRHGRLRGPLLGGGLLGGRHARSGNDRIDAATGAAANDGIALTNALNALAQSGFTAILKSTKNHYL